MGWETRNGRGHYYTRSKKVNGRVIREYVGTGLIGMAEACSDEIERKERNADRAGSMIQRQNVREVEGETKKYPTMVESLTKEVLTSVGYHKHKHGEWRKKRGGCQDKQRTHVSSSKRL